MAEVTYYKAVKGVTHGMTYYEPGVVFAGDEVLDEQFSATGGKTLDGEVLYEKASRSDYEDYLRSVDHSLVDGAPKNVVGFEATGENSLVDSQVAEVKDDGERVLVEADEQTGKAEDGDPIPPDSAEAARRLGAPDEAIAGVEPAAGDEGGSGAAPEQQSEADSKTRKRGSGSGA